MQKNINFSIFIPIILSILISIFYIPVISYSNTNNLILTATALPIYPKNYSSATSYYLWPTPGYSKITSYFGHRKAPTIGAGTYHGGIDIAAPQNSSIIAIADGIVTFVGWYGANGYTIIIQHENGYNSIYGHISPNFIVSVNDLVSKGQLIAKVGPKYIDKKNYTTYKDKNGKYTNGATTRSTFTFFNNKRK